MNTSRTIIIGSRSNLTGALASRLGDPVILSSAEISKLTVVLGACGSADIIYNAFVKSSRLRQTNDPKEYSRYTFEALSEFIAVCLSNQGRIRTILYTSSSSVYGDNSSASELDHCEIRGLYPAVKLASELFLSDHLRDTRVRVIIPRVFNMYGGRDEFSIVAKIANALRTNTEITISNDGEAIRDFIDIEDVVDAYTALLESCYEGVINVGTGRGMSVRRVIEAAERASDARLRIKNVKSSEIRVSIACIDRVQKLMPGHAFRTVEDYYTGIAGRNEAPQKPGRKPDDKKYI